MLVIFKADDNINIVDAARYVEKFLHGYSDEPDYDLNERFFYSIIKSMKRFSSDGTTLSEEEFCKIMVCIKGCLFFIRIIIIRIQITMINCTMINSLQESFKEWI